MSLVRTCEEQDLPSDSITQRQTSADLALLGGVYTRVRFAHQIKRLSVLFLPRFHRQATLS